MNFSTREDIEAPIQSVWTAVTDFEHFERQAMRRGAEVSRSDPRGRPGPDSEWNVCFTYRGRPREIDARIAEFDAPNALRLDSVSGGLDAVMRIELMSLSPRRTRLNIALDLTPRTLTARLLVQSLKFARTNLGKRFANRVYDFAQGVEGRYRNAG